MSLIRRRSVHAIDARFDQSTRQSRQGIAGLDPDGPILRTHLLPLILRIEDLQSSHGLSETQCNSPQARVPWAGQVADLLVLFATARSIVHVTQMVLAPNVVLVIANQLVFIREFEEDGEETKQLFYYFNVAFLWNAQVSN